MYSSNTDLVLKKRLANVKVATTKSCRLLQQNANHIKQATVKPVVKRINVL